MQLLRFPELHNGVYVKLNRATMNMIRTVEPLITYGYPTRDIVRKFVTREATVRSTNLELLSMTTPSFPRL